MGIMQRIIKKKETAPKGARAAVSSGTEALAATKGSKSAAYQIIIRPLITEKTAALTTGSNTYTFVVARAAKKPHIVAAVEALYGVKPIAVNVVNMDGHRVRFGKSAGRRSDYKKAFVTLKKGATITIHEGV